MIFKGSHRTFILKQQHFAIKRFHFYFLKWLQRLKKAACEAENKTLVF